MLGIQGFNNLVDDMESHIINDTFSISTKSSKARFQGVNDMGKVYLVLGLQGAQLVQTFKHSMKHPHSL